MTGAITPIVRGQSFVPTVSGSSHARRVFRLEGEVFATQDFGATGC